MNLAGVVRGGQPFAPWPERFRRKWRDRNSLPHNYIETFIPARMSAGFPGEETIILLLMGEAAIALRGAGGCGCAIFPSAESSKGVA